jgi:hypothetical protein
MTRRPARAACAALALHAALSALAALAACVPAAARAQRPAPSPAPIVVVDASDFLHEIQKGHTITDATALRVPWVFNNTALELRTRSNYVIRARVPAAGTYHLYVRSHGAPGSAFRVAVGDRVIDHDVGTAPMRLERAGTFELRAGEVDVRLMRIEGTPVFDVLALSPRAALTDADLQPLQLRPEVARRAEYRVPRGAIVKFGDLTGDGRVDLLALAPGYSARAIDHDGRELWSWDAPAEHERLRAEFEAPGVVWDLDGDGAAEAVHWRLEEGREWLVVADGRTGAVRRRAPWPTRPLPHVYNNFRLAVARLASGRPRDLVALSDFGDTIVVAAYDAELRERWRHVETRKKDHLGHYVYPVDLTGDGVDEVVVGSLVLDARGKPLWNRFDLFYDNHDHADSYRFPDLDGDGRPEIVSAQSEAGVFAFDARTGAVRWQHAGEHSQQIEVGRFLDGVPGPQIAIGARTYGNRQAGEPYLSGQVWWFDARGTLLSKWPALPLNGNPVFVAGDWTGRGRPALFWYKFRMRGDGRGELFFPEPVFHMFDFLGDGAEEVLTLQGEWLRVYGHRDADPRGARVRRGDDYLRDHVANHTHY